MSITDHYNKTVLVQRLAAVTGTKTETYATHIASVSCHIQPLDEGWSEDKPGTFGKDWLMFCAAQDILENDKVVDGSSKYLVVGVESFFFRGTARHMELRIRKLKP